MRRQIVERKERERAASDFERGDDKRRSSVVEAVEEGRRRLVAKGFRRLREGLRTLVSCRVI